jgi:regulator of RNase E activity RraB
MLALSILFAIFACNKSDDDLDKDFAIAYAELRIAEREYGETEDGKMVCFEILQRYGMDAALFEEKIEEIKNKPEKWLEFQNMFMAVLDSIGNYLQTELDSIAKNTQTKEGT